MKNLREKFNDAVREWGNKKSPMPTNWLHACSRMNLGDILTAEITPRRVGATIGALAPLAALYGLEYYNTGSHFFSAIGSIGWYIGAFPLTITSSILLARGGYTGGYKLENGFDNIKNYFKRSN